MLDNLFEKEPSFREPFEIRMDNLLQLNIPYALALLDNLIPALEAADAGHQATQTTVSHEVTPDYVPEAWVAEEVVRQAEAITAEAARIEDSMVQPEAVSQSQPAGTTAVMTKAETNAAANLTIDESQARLAQEALDQINKIHGN